MLLRRMRAGLLLGVVLSATTFALLSGTLPLPEPVRRAVALVVRRGELQASDLLLLTAGLDRPGGDDIVLLLVDQGDLREVERMTGYGWPWPREYWSVLTRYLAEAGASPICWTLFFTEASRYREDDEAFGTAIADSGRTVLSVFTTNVPAGSGARRPAMPPDVFAAAHVALDGGRRELPTRSRLVPPLPEIGRGAAALAIGETQPDPDALVRRLVPALIVGDHAVATFATRIAMLRLGVESLRIDGDQLWLGQHAYPLSADDHHLLLRFRQRSRGGFSFRALPVAGLLRAAFDWAEERQGVRPEDREALGGRIAIVGVSAPGVEDIEITPVSSTFPGPELHATAVDNFLRGDFLAEWPRSREGRHLPAAAVTLLVSLVAILSPSAATAAVASGAVFLAYFGIAWGTYRAGLLLPLFGPLAGAIAAFGSSTLYLYVTEGRQRREIARMFGQYLAPAVVEELQRHPEKLRLGGERRVMTAFFSDIEGFTTVSESMQAERLVALLNEYLTLCTDVILETGGVIDKYLGDGIMAFWNAPLEVADHARRACIAAIRCQDACVAFRASCEARGLPPIRMRIGLNTGPMVVGNMGSSRRFDYTLMGDAVNLASRLEGANKAFGTYMMASDATRRACGPGVAFRELGRIRVKGKTEAVAVHEVLGAGAAPPWVARFEAALGAFYARRFDEAAAGFVEVLGLRPDDPPSMCYLARLPEVRRSVPAAGFDGVLTLAEK